MGGDLGPEVVFAASLEALKRHPELHIHLVGDEQALRDLLDEQPENSERLHIVHAPDVVAMRDKPSVALRNRRESSMRIAIDLVKDGTCGACVSAGNTGALMAIARFVLKTLPGIDRPAICAAMPSLYGTTHMLDLGANVDSSSEELFRFAVMGSVLASAVGNEAAPSVALLNIGEEEIKGNDRVKQTAVLLESSALNYVGFAEGNDIFKSKFDIIVCDGFVGNVALKASEGVASMLAEMAREEFERSFYRKLCAVFAKPALRSLRHRADPRRYNGASLLGLRGIVVKSHGSADSVSFGHAIEQALIETQQSITNQITDQLEASLSS